MVLEPFIKRDIFNDLLSHLNKREISLIVGPRQAGKTTLMMLIKEHLDKLGEKTLFFSLDFEKDKEFFVSQDALIKKLNLEFGDKKGYVFIDEIQRKEDAGLFLKGIYDMGVPHKLIVSGSGSVELKEKVHESLAGRKLLFELSTISFKEFVNFNTDYRYEEKFDEFLSVETRQVSSYLEDYLKFGGYPRVVLEKEFSAKLRAIDEIYRSYIEKDVSFLLRVEKTEAYNSLVKILASQIGSLVNYTELSNTLDVSVKTIKNYLWYAEKTFIVNKISPYFKNVRKEITKAPLFYFCDLGLLNYSTGLFGKTSSLVGRGFLFENLIFSMLKEKLRLTGSSVRFWRTIDGAEVDFVIDFGARVVPVEVKYRDLDKPSVERSMRSFIEKYQPQKAYVINKNFNTSTTVKNTELQFVSYNNFVKNNFIF